MTAWSRFALSTALAPLLLGALAACRPPEPSPRDAPTSSDTPRETGEPAVLRCLYSLPVAACEAAGVAVFDRHLAVSVAASAIVREYCGGDQPTAGLRSGFLVLDRASGEPLLDAPVPLEGGFGGAEADGREHLWQSLYSEGVIARVRIAPDDPAASGLIATVPIPAGGRIGGVAFDGEHLWGHDADRDRLLVIDSSTGALVRSMAPPYDRAVNGIAWAGGRLYALLNDDASGPGSERDGAVPEAIVRLDPADGRELARWPLPDGLYPHSMDAGGSQSLVILFQRGLDARRPGEIWELRLPAGGGAGAIPVHTVPCSGKPTDSTNPPAEVAAQ